MDFMLPTPRVPGAAFANKVPPLDLLESLVPGAGAGVARALAARQEVLDLIADLEDCRPGGGGRRWREALAADAAAFGAGSWPRKSAVETLLGSDLSRWAKVSAACRTLSARRDAALNESRSTAGLAAAARSREAAARTSLVVDAQTAYAKAVTGRTDDRAAAWASFSAAREASEVCATMRALVAWVDGRDGGYDPEGWGPAWDPTTAGYMYGTEDLLEGRKRLVLPAGVRWPSKHPAAATLVGPSTSTGLLTKGYAEAVEPGGV